MTKEQRTCNKECFFVGRKWVPGEVIGEADIPASGLSRHFGPIKTAQAKKSITKQGVEGVVAPRPELKNQPIPVSGDVSAGEPATLADGQSQLLGDTVLQPEGTGPATIGEASAFS